MYFILWRRTFGITRKGSWNVDGDYETLSEVNESVRENYIPQGDDVEFTITKRIDYV